MVPAYIRTLSAIRNLVALASHCALTPLPDNPNDASAQMLAFLAKRIGVQDPSGAAVEATADAVTYTAAQFATGLVKRDCAGGNRSDTTPTAAQLITGLSLGNDFESACVFIYNTSDAAETITLGGGSNVTLHGTITVAQSAFVRLIVTRTSSTTVSIRAA